MRELAGQERRDRPELARRRTSPPTHRLVERLRRVGDFEVAAEAGVDERRRLRRARPGRGQLRPGRDALRARRRRAGRDRRRSSATYLRAPGSSCSARESMRALPRPRRARAVPVRAARRLARRGARPRGRRDRLRHGRPARGDAGVHPRGARRRDHELSRPTRARSGCRSCARRSRRGSSAASASRSTPTPRSCRRSARRRRSSRSRRSRSASGASSPCPSPRYPVYERGALFAGAEVVTVPLREENGWLPDLDAFDLGRARASSGSATRTTRPARRRRSRSTRSSPGWRASTGSSLCSDEAYSELWFGEPPVSALQVADRSNVVVFNTLSKRSSMTGYRSGFVVRAAGRSPPRCGRSARRRHRAAGVRPARRGRRLGGRGARRRGARASTARKREALLPALEAAGFRLAGGDATFFLWLAVEEPSETVAAPPARARHARRARLVLRPCRRGLRAARARPDAGGVRACGAAAGGYLAITRWPDKKGPCCFR